MTTLIIPYFHTIVQFNLPDGNPVTQIFVLRTFMPLYNTKRTDENPVWYCTVSLLSHCAIQPYMWQRCGIIVLYSKVGLLYNSIKVIQHHICPILQWHKCDTLSLYAIVQHNSIDGNPAAYYVYCIILMPSHTNLTDSNRVQCTTEHLGHSYFSTDAVYYGDQVAEHDMHSQICIKGRDNANLRARVDLNQILSHSHCSG